MIQSRLSRLMGEKRVRVSDVARATGISRNMVARLYYDHARRIELRDLDKLCAYFGRSVGDLLEWKPEQSTGRVEETKKSSSSGKAKRGSGHSQVEVRRPT